ncbi:NAD(P)/FAD-dependent oxidoreductase [Roseovarius salinarum]|uniref:NAD(P)/FAD-dependent oxidoreductase n=1 Tax=Roseovarius salinarum TaxID=1981892 RepID=UPI000C331B9B|nr:FAD-binding oxidoreductase [Roseovarius salinarum]
MSDVIVIGGGIAGISAAARLAPDARVTLLEAEAALGFHASGRSAALFEANYGLPSTVALSRASAAYHHAANGGYLTPRGFMVVARTGDEAALAADMAALQLRAITPAEAIERLPILDPDKLGAAAFHEEAWDVDTDRMIQDFARSLRAHGGAVQLSAPVTAISRTGGRWRVDTPQGAHEADVVVNAAGAWVDRIAEMAGVAPLGFTPRRRSMARLRAPGGHDVSGWPMTLGVAESWYCKPDAGALLVSPADADPAEPHDAWADDMVLAEGLARYEAMVTEPVTRPLADWAGLRTFSPDGALVIGCDPEMPQFFWCAGQGGYGFQTAPAASRLAADLVTGRAPEMDADAVAALDPKRFA